MTKEQIYDEKINPLMAQILTICKDHKIAMLADFSIPNEDDDGLKCTSAMLDKEHNPPENMLKALELLRPRRGLRPLMMTTTHADGSKTLTAILD